MRIGAVARSRSRDWRKPNTSTLGKFICLVLATGEPWLLGGTPLCFDQTTQPGLESLMTFKVVLGRPQTIRSLLIIFNVPWAPGQGAEGRRQLRCAGRGLVAGTSCWAMSL